MRLPGRRPVHGVAITPAAGHPALLVADRAAVACAVPNFRTPRIVLSIDRSAVKRQCRSDHPEDRKDRLSHCKGRLFRRRAQTQGRHSTSHAGNDPGRLRSERWPLSIGTHGRVQSEPPAAIIGIRSRERFSRNCYVAHVDPGAAVGTCYGSSRI
jgi:hypothetical protein